MNKKRRKGFNQSTVRCPYCGSPAVLRSADGIYRDNSKNTMLYVCKNYPACDSYVRVHTGTNCKEVIRESRKLLESRNRRKQRPALQQPELKLIEGGAAS